MQLSNLHPPFRDCGHDLRLCLYGVSAALAGKGSIEGLRTMRLWLEKRVRNPLREGNSVV